MDIAPTASTSEPDDRHSPGGPGAEALCTVFDHAAAGMAVLALDGIYQDANPSLCRLLGYAHEEMLALSLLDVIQPEDAGLCREAMGRLLAGESSAELLVTRYVRRDGAAVRAEVSISVARDANGTPLHFLTLEQDVSEHAAVDVEIARLNRLLWLLSDVNRGIAKAEEEGALLEAVCRIAVKRGGFKRAAVFLVAEDGQSVRPAAQAGFEDGDLQSFDFPPADGPGEQPPVVAAILTGQRQVRQEPWQGAVAEPREGRIWERGIRSVGAFPLLMRGQAVGAASFYSAEARFVDESEIRVLDDLAMDLSFALEQFERERERRAGVEALRLNAKLYRDLVEDAHSAILRADADFNVTFANEYALRTFGYDADELLGHNVVGTIVPEVESTGRDLGALMRAIVADPDAYSFNVNENITKDGRRLWCLWTNHHYYDDEGRFDGLLCVGNDVTGLKRAEERIARLNTVLRIVSTVDGLIVRERSPERLLQDACNCLVSAESHVCAWAATLDADGHLGRIVTAGRDSSASAACDLIARGGLPPCAGRAIDGLDANDVMVSPELCSACPLQGGDRRLGHMEARLVHEGRLLGLLIVCMEVDLTADPTEHKLLADVAGDLAYAVHAIEVAKARGQAEMALRESEERYRRVVQDQTEMICRSLPDGTITFVNDAYRRCFGRPGEELVGSNVFAQMPDELRARVEEATARLTPPEPAVTIELPFAPPDGGGRWLQWTHRSIFDDAGQVTEWQATGQDITDRRRAESALRRYELLSQNALDIILFVRTDGRIIEANRAAVSTYGYDRDELLSLTIFDLRQTAAPMTLEEQVSRAGSEGLRFEVVHRRKDKSSFPAEVSSRAVSMDGETVLISIIRDITDRKLAEDAYRLQSVGQLAGGIGHDFNNILASMMMRAELAAIEPSVRACEELATGVLRAGRRGAQICRSLMAFARPEEPRRAPVHIESCTDAALSMAARQMEVAGVSVTRDYDANTLRANVDAAQMEQVFLNLFINACHAMPAGGKLSVATRYGAGETGEDEVTVTVADTGTGIEPEHLRRVFEPFFTTKGRLGESETAGTGLGLPTSHGIITAHGGSITVSSEVGQGTTFAVVLPIGVSDEGVEKGAPLVSAGLVEPAGGGHILVVDDEAELRGLIADMLTLAGYSVSTVVRTEEAVAILQGGRFDLIISDLMMPGGGGKGVLKAARALAQPPPVVVITGRLEGAIQNELLRLGAVACVEKPFSQAHLLQTVNRLLASGRTD